MTKRLLMAYLIAPLVPSLLDGSWSIARNAARANAPFEISNLLNPMLTTVSYACACLIGIPAYFLLRQCLGRTSWKYALCGSVIGCVPALLLAVTVSDDSGLGSGVATVAVVIGLIYGAVGGLAFWLIGIVQRAGRKSRNSA